jgi:hypothetical protein
MSILYKERYIYESRKVFIKINLDVSICKYEYINTYMEISCINIYMCVWLYVFFIGKKDIYIFAFNYIFYI